MTAQLARQEQQLDDLEQAVGDLRTPPTPAAQTATVAFRWATLDQFVDHVIAPLYAQHLTGNATWCASWLDHDDALVRLEAVWRAWEALRLEPTTGSPGGCAPSPTPRWTGSATGTAARSGPASKAST